jgi:hypothetical protein
MVGEELAMPKSANEPPDLVLEHLRVMREENKAMREENKAMRAETKAQLDDMKSDISAIKAALRGLERNTIAEVYKANLTVASFAEHEQRIQALEQRSS